MAVVAIGHPGFETRLLGLRIGQAPPLVELQLGNAYSLKNMSLAFSKIAVIFGALIFIGFAAPRVNAAVRGESPTVLGDARQVGLAGASLAMPDSIHSAMDNPANASVEKWAISLSFQNDRVRDSRMNSDGEFREGEGKGLLASSPRFGFFFGHRLPSQETDGSTTVEVQETHFGAAYRFSDHLIAGASVISARADWATTTTEHASAWTAAFGATYIHERFRYALAFRPSVPITGVNQPDALRVVEIPWRLSVGASYALLSDVFLHGALITFGGQKGARQMASPNAPAADSFALQPRLGVEYRIVESDPWGLSVFAGGYVEPGRMEGYNARVHTTGGVSLGFLSARASIAIDRAPGYKNVLSYIGVDILDALIRLRAFPFLDKFKEPVTPPADSPRLEPEHDATNRFE